MRKRASKEKRKPAQSFDRSKPVPLSEIINFGPVTLPEFEAIGITTLDQMEELGFEEVARRWVEYFPERLNVNAFTGIVATLDGVSWTQINASQKAKARNLVNEMRRDLNLKPVAGRKSKKTSR